MLIKYHYHITQLLTFEEQVVHHDVPLPGLGAVSPVRSDHNIVSHRAPPRVSVELPRDHLVKEPGELRGRAGPWPDAGLVVAVEVDLLGAKLLRDVAPPVVQRQAAPIGLAHLSSNYQQRDVDLASLIHI